MVTLKEASVEVIKIGMLCTLAIPAIKANPHSPLALFHGFLMVVFLVNCLKKEANSLLANFFPILKLKFINPKDSRIDTIVIFHTEGSLTMPTNHTIIITHDNAI